MFRAPRHEARDVAAARKIRAARADDDRADTRVTIELGENRRKLLTLGHRDHVERRPIENDVGALARRVNLDAKAVEALQLVRNRALDFARHSDAPLRCHSRSLNHSPVRYSPSTWPSSTGWSAPAPSRAIILRRRFARLSAIRTARTKSSPRKCTEQLKVIRWPPGASTRIAAALRSTYSRPACAALSRARASGGGSRTMTSNFSPHDARYSPAWACTNRARSEGSSLSARLRRAQSSARAEVSTPITSRAPAFRAIKANPPE